MRLTIDMHVHEPKITFVIQDQKLSVFAAVLCRNSEYPCRVESSCRAPRVCHERKVLQLHSSILIAPPIQNSSSSMFLEVNVASLLFKLTTMVLPISSTTTNISLTSHDAIQHHLPRDIHTLAPLCSKVTHPLVLHFVDASLMDNLINQQYQQMKRHSHGKFKVLIYISNDDYFT